MRLVYAALLIVVTTLPAFAQREPEIVIPGKPGVPVIINGVDASWGVVIGEFGLDRPGAMAPVVIQRPLVIDFPYAVPSYFPRTGRRPGYGRYEIIPPANRRLPPPAPTYYRSWSSESAPTPATEYLPYAPPPVFVSPRYRPHSSFSDSNNQSPGSPGQGSSGQSNANRGHTSLGDPITNSPSPNHASPNHKS